MSSIYQTTSVWSGASGLPGYTNLFFDAPGADVAAEIVSVADAVHDFWAAMTGALASGVSITTNAEIRQLNAETGVLETLWAIVPAPTAVGGGGSGIGPSPAGACISWNTGEVHAGHVVRGRTFIVPIALNVYQADGTLTTGAVTIFNDAAVGLIGHSGPEFVIWSRPFPGDPDAVPPKASHLGAAFPAMTGICKDKVAVLRSRRD
jgi:hypothetical protein